MARRVSFHTGEFAKIVGVNKRTLHYYDAEGIFRPAKVEPNGYRSYSFQQFYPFYILRLFRAMGLDLAEIKDYMSHRSPERLDRLLAEQQDWLRQEIERLKRQQEIVRNQRSLLALSKTVVCGQVEEKEMSETRLILSRNVRSLAAKGDWPTVERIATEHTRYVAEKKAGAGFGIGMMVAPEDFLVPGGDEIVSYYFTVTERPLRYIDREYRFVRPAGRYLVTYFSGDYDDTSAAYALLREYLSAHGLVPTGCSYEESILEDMSTMRMEDDLTRILVPVKDRQQA